MINPINKDFKTSLVDKISTVLIIEKYKNEFNIDVSEYFQGIEFVQIFECVETKYRFYFPYSIIGDKKFYVNLSKGRMNYYHERWEHKVALKFAKNGENWLEVGSGNSYFLKELSKIGVKSLGLELNSDEVKRVKNEKFEVLDYDFFSFNDKKGEYDTIASFQVLEHICDISTFFIHCREMIKSKGKLVIAVPNNNPYLYVFDKYHTLNLPPHHMGLWSGRSLKNVGKNFGFSVKKLKYEPISQLELNYILNFNSGNSLSIKNIKFSFLKVIKRAFSEKFFLLVSSVFRKYFVNGRNIIIVFEKND